MVIARYELVLHGPAGYETDVLQLVEARDALPPLLREAEENITIMLPQDYHVTIEERKPDER